MTAMRAGENLRGSSIAVLEEDDATTTKPDIEEVLEEAEETQDRDAYADETG